MWIGVFLFLIMTTLNAVEEPYQAVRMMDAASFEEAAVLYEEMLRKSSDPSQVVYARYRLAQALFLANKYEAVIELMQDDVREQQTSLKKMDRNAAMAMKCLALAYIHLGDYQQNIEEKKKALPILEQLMNDSEVMGLFDEPDEILYLYGWVHSKCCTGDLQAIQKALNAVTKDYSRGKYADQAYYLLGMSAFHAGNFSDAEAAFKAITDNYPSSVHMADSLFFAARSADEQHKEGAISRGYRKKIFQEHPDSRYGDEAYFTFFSPAEYLQGDQFAIRHLQEMAQKYPHSPFLIHAYYLIGLNHRRIHKGGDNASIQERRLIDAIDAFQAAELQFELWIEGKASLSKEKIDHFFGIYLRALIERAYTNIAIADLSKGTKRQIYLEYAIDLLKQTKADFETPKSKIAFLVGNIKFYHPLHEETDYLLAYVHRKAEKNSDAAAILDNMLKKYRDLHVTRGYFLSRVWYDKGVIAMHDRDYEAALEGFSNAEEAAKGKILSVDENLDLWIQRSYCYREMDQYDKAMLILSQVINEDVISNLRLKAMYLRAEIYELQGRRELAIKQLQATANKGGEWGHQSKDKLEKEYGL